MNERSGDGQPSIPADADIIDINFTPVADSWVARPARRRRPLWPALTLFVLTAISTLAVGSEFAISYAANQEPFTASGGDLFASFGHALAHPQLLLLGIPFSFTLMGILLAHELGHYFACRFYGIGARSSTWDFRGRSWDFCWRFRRWRTAWRRQRLCRTCRARRSSILARRR